MSLLNTRCNNFGTSSSQNNIKKSFPLNDFAKFEIQEPGDREVETNLLYKSTTGKFIFN